MRLPLSLLGSCRWLGVFQRWFYRVGGNGHLEAWRSRLLTYPSLVLMLTFFGCWSGTWVPRGSACRARKQGAAYILRSLALAAPLVAMRLLGSQNSCSLTVSRTLLIAVLLWPWRFFLAKVIVAQSGFGTYGIPVNRAGVLQGSRGV